MSENVVYIIKYVLFALPILLAVINAKKYGIIHGLIVFVCFSVLIEGAGVLVSFLGDKIGSFKTTADSLATAFTFEKDLLATPFNELFEKYNIEIMYKNAWKYAVYGGVFIVCQLIASRIRENKIETKATRRI